MKAKEYVKNFSDLSVEDATSEILQGLMEEAEAIAKKRNCAGGADTDTTFDAYTECYFEQFVKWLQICRLDCRYSLNDFVHHLTKYYPLVLGTIKRRMIPYFQVISHH